MIAFLCGVGKTNIPSGMNPCSCLSTSKCSPQSLTESCSDKIAESNWLHMTDAPKKAKAKRYLTYWYYHTL